MDWAGFMGFTAEPPQPFEDLLDGDDDVEDDEDLYGFGQNGDVHMQTAEGASSSDQPVQNMPADAGTMNSGVQTPQTPPADDPKKFDHQKQLDDLRKKLLAKRATSQRPDTPSKASVASEPPQEPKQEKHQHNDKKDSQDNKQANDDFGIESLLAEGKAAAEAKAARDQQATVALAASIHAPAKIAQQSAAPSQPANDEFEETEQVVSQGKQPKPDKTDHTSPPKPTDLNTNNTISTAHPSYLSDQYYDDLADWLEFSGYHNVQYRKSRLTTYKLRRELQEQAARIAEQLEQLDQNEEANIVSFRDATSHPPSTTSMAPPPLPQSIPAGDHRVNTNGVKRPHSPESTISEKSSRRGTDSGYRIRGSHDAGRGLAHNNSSPLERRGSFSDRRGSFDGRHERDPSLERRQQNYKRGNPSREHGFRRSFSYDQRIPSREGPGPRPFNARERERDGRIGFSSVNRMPSQPAHNGNSSLDLRKGGVRYFMIKSWNHDNVAQAMRDGLWATQEKNQGLLTEAFHTSRHVILLFSVNKSMAFQGYAIMTSPPDNSLPRPNFCNKLNWATSPGFQVRWLATTPVHFRFVGHLKNTCNPDDEGQPRAVLVGKDGQEISQDAGMGVVGILNDAEQQEGKGVLREHRE